MARKKKTFKKEHPIIFWAAMAGIASLFLSAITFYFLVIEPRIRNSAHEKEFPEKIYLAISDGGVKKRLDLNGGEITLSENIKPNVPTKFLFLLYQGHVNAPKITAVFMGFPTTVEINPIPDKGRTWEGVSGTENSYVLYLSYSQLPSGVPYYSFPHLGVTLKEKDLDSIPISYRIIGDGMEAINQSFKIVIKTQDKTDILPDVPDLSKFNPPGNQVSPPGVQFPQLTPDRGQR